MVKTPPWRPREEVNAAPRNTAHHYYILCNNATTHLRAVRVERSEEVERAMVGSTCDLALTLLLSLRYMSKPCSFDWERGCFGGASIVKISDFEKGRELFLLFGVRNSLRESAIPAPTSV